MGDDEAALLRLWREKRGEVEPEDHTVKLCARFESDDQLAAELYRLAQAAKLTRLRPREDEGLWEGSSSPR